MGEGEVGRYHEEVSRPREGEGGGGVELDSKLTLTRALLSLVSQDLEETITRRTSSGYDNRAFVTEGVAGNPGRGRHDGLILQFSRSRRSSLLDFVDLTLVRCIAVDSPGLMMRSRMSQEQGEKGYRITN